MQPDTPDLTTQATAPATRLLVTLAAITFVAHMLVAGNYGYFRDELYYIADGWHLQAGYVDQPLLMGWLAALLRVTIGDSLIAIHIIPALACALLVVVTGYIARELGGGRTAQLVAGLTAMFTINFMATGSLFSMDVLDQLWWAVATLIIARILRLNRSSPRLWLLFGLVAAVGLLTKLTILFFGFALVLALLATPQRRLLRTPWPWLAGVIAFVGLLPYLIWNALNGWPTLDFWRNYGGVGTGPLDFFIAQIGQLNPAALPLAVAGLAFYFRKSGAPFRPLGWMFVLLYLMLTIIGSKPYFLSPAYPIVFAAGAVLFERLRLRPLLAWLRPAYVTLIVLIALLLAPGVMPILPPDTLVRVFPNIEQVLADRFGWDTLTQTVEQVYAALPSDQRAQACVLTSNYGEAGALSKLAPPGALPPVISGHNNYYLWGPGTCTGQVLILVGYSQSDLQSSSVSLTYTLAATQRCPYCVSFEQNLPIYVVRGGANFDLARLWPMLKHYD